MAAILDYQMNPMFSNVHLKSQHDFDITEQEYAEFEFKSFDPRDSLWLGGTWELVSPRMFNTKLTFTYDPAHKCLDRTCELERPRRFFRNVASVSHTRLFNFGLFFAEDSNNATVKSTIYEKLMPNGTVALGTVSNDGKTYIERQSNGTVTTTHFECKNRCIVTVENPRSPTMRMEFVRRYY